MVLPLIPNVFILVEGRTEETYLRHLKERGCNYSVHIERFNGNQPLKMVKRCSARFKEKGMHRIDGDRAFCVFDVDNNPLEDLEKALEYALKHDISVIISNPCFEAFFLLHFVETVPLENAQYIKSVTAQYIEGYCETMDCWKKLLDQKEKAIRRARKFNGLDDIRNGVSGTNIWILFDVLEQMRDKGTE